MDRLHEHRIPFAAIGAAAMAVHGAPRSTVDIDLLTTLRACLDEAMWASAIASGITVRVRRGDSEDPLAGVVRFSGRPATRIDLVVGKLAWQAAVVERARPAEIERVLLPVATPPDLILLKLYAGGPQDAWDVEQLLGSEQRDALVEDVDRTVGALPADARRLWARIRRSG